MAVTIAQEFFLADFSNYGYRNQEMELKMQACSGTFQQRYDCKNQLIVDKGYSDFLLWIGKVIWIFVPPMIFFGIVRLTKPKGGRGSDRTDNIDLSKWRS